MAASHDDVRGVIANLQLTIDKAKDGVSSETSVEFIAGMQQLGDLTGLSEFVSNTIATIHDNNNNDDGDDDEKSEKIMPEKSA